MLSLLQVDTSRLTRLWLPLREMAEKRVLMHIGQDWRDQESQYGFPRKPRGGQTPKLISSFPLEEAAGYRE